jgi:2-phosphosulfolactate phosphatase
MRVHVALTPAEFPDAPLTGCVALAVDVLRATTASVAACEAGCRGLVPVPDTAAAEALAARDGADTVRAGERGGEALAGFDLGNSPAEYTAETVAGRELIFASTNGSRALLAAAGARRRLIGAFVNAGAVLRRLEQSPDVTVVCAGKESRFSLEDAGFAGWLCSALAKRGATLENDAARFAASVAPCDADAVRALVEGSAHARDLRALGPEYDADVRYCATLDALDRVFEA